MRILKQSATYIGLGAALFSCTGLANAQLANFPQDHAFLPIKAVTIAPPPGFEQSIIPLAEQTHLTLQEAILIALKHNTKLETSLNNRQLQRYDLITAQQKFEPVFTITNTAGYTKSDSGPGTASQQRALSVGPNMKWTFPLGTSVSAGLTYNPITIHSDNSSTTYNTGYNITVTQPLLKGFGVAVNEVALDNAYTTQKIDDITLKQTVQSTLTSVASAFYAVVQAKQSYKIAQNSVKTAEKTLKDRQAKFKAGQTPETDVTQASLTLITQQQGLQTAEQSFNTAKAALLNTLGLPSNTIFQVDDDLKVKELNPKMLTAIKKALKSNLTVKTDHLNAKIAQRNIITSNNNQLWQLDLTLNKSRSRSNLNYASSANTDSSSLTNNTSASLALTIPLDRTTLDQSKLKAAISLQNDQLNEAQSKRTVVNNVEAAVNNLKNQWVQLEVTKEKLKLTQATTRAAEIRYQYGKIGAFTLSQQQNNLVTARQGLVSAKISYLKDLMAYRTLVGTLLKHWNIHVEARSV